MCLDVTSFQNWRRSLAVSSKKKKLIRHRNDKNNQNMDEVIQIGTHIGINNFCACFAHVWKAGANWYSFGTLYCHYFKMKIFLEQKKLNYFVQKNNSKIIYAQDIDFSTFWVSEKVKSCNQPLQFKTGTICLFVLAFLPKITFSLGIFLLCTVKPSLSFLILLQISGVAHWVADITITGSHIWSLLWGCYLDLWCNTRGPLDALTRASPF